MLDQEAPLVLGDDFEVSAHLETVSHDMIILGVSLVAHEDSFLIDSLFYTECNSIIDKGL